MEIEKEINELKKKVSSLEAKKDGYIDMTKKESVEQDSPLFDTGLPDASEFNERAKRAIEF